MAHDVLVVGAGPVGLTMAAELARYGVPVRIVEQNAHASDKSKALVLWSRSLELIDRMGCGAQFVDAGLKVNSASMMAGKNEVAHIRLDGVATPHPYALMLPQSETERLMERHLNACGLQVERQTQLTRFTPGADGVAATLRHADGRDEAVDAMRGPGGSRAPDPVWPSSLRINERKMADYRAGRVFLAGDAAAPRPVSRRRALAGAAGRLRGGNRRARWLASGRRLVRSRDGRVAGAVRMPPPSRPPSGPARSRAPPARRHPAR